MREAPRERELHLLDGLWGKCHRHRLQALVDRRPIVPRHGRHVLGGLEPSFDLQRRDPGRHEPRHELPRREILRREQIPLVAEIFVAAVADELVGEPAGLGALAAVGAPAAERLAREALAGVGHAERSVDEDLELERCLRPDRRDLGHRQLPRDHDPLDPERLGEADRLRARERHLRRGVQGERRADLPHERRRPDILQEHGIDAGLGDGRHRVGEGVELVGEDERVERGIALEAPEVERPHQLRERLDGKVRRAGPRVEADVEPEVDRVGAVLDGGPDAVEVARWGEQFGPSVSHGRARAIAPRRARPCSRCPRRRSPGGNSRRPRRRRRRPLRRSCSCGSASSRRCTSSG